MRPISDGRPGDFLFDIYDLPSFQVIVAILVKDLKWLILLELQPTNREPIHLLLVHIFILSLEVLL